MDGGHVGYQRHVELLRGGHRRPAFRSGMPHDRVGEMIYPQVEVALVGIAPLGRRGVNQRQAEHVVGRFVPAVFAVVEHRNAVRAVGVGQIGPFQSRHLVGRCRVVTALDIADTEVVGGLFIAHRHGEFGFEQRIAAVPVDSRMNIQPVVRRAVGQRKVLRELRIAPRALDLERSPHGALFTHRNRHLSVDRTRRLVHHLLEHLPGRPLVRGISLEYRQPERLALLDQLAAAALVD